MTVEPSMPRTSVLCSVWSGDPQRWERLRGHAANLRRQTTPVVPFYILDNNDPPPDWLPGRVITSREPLTVVQAWNVALALVETPYVMNLNLDDRLTPDAVALLQAELERTKAVTIGGDWQVCYSQEETDAVPDSFPAHNLPFDPQWPPVFGVHTRLGSGTGERTTLGPATLWRMSVHLKIPRYPWRAVDGTLLRGATDAMWWELLDMLQQKIARIPVVIGHYYSHPLDQGEFRHPADDEWERLSRVGISLL